MTDAELADWLHLSPDEAEVVLPKLSPERRAVYERMAEVEIEVGLWLAGLGPLPEDVICLRR